MCADQVRASPFGGMLGAEPRRPMPSQAKAGDAELGSQGQRGSDGAHVVQNIREGSSHLEGEGGEDDGDLQTRPRPPCVAKEIVPLHRGGQLLGEAYRRQGKPSAWKEVGHENSEARLGGVLVGEELVVDEVEAEVVGQEDDGRVGGRSAARDICLHVEEGLEVAERLSRGDGARKEVGACWWWQWWQVAGGGTRHAGRRRWSWRWPWCWGERLKLHACP